VRRALCDVASLDEDRDASLIERILAAYRDCAPAAP